ncbi:hypothetical protein MBLNU230_g4101t1 [Neophaeotheca triangularis]
MERIKPCSELTACQALSGDDTCTYQSDPDIAGIGVLVSFVVSAWIAFALVIIGYLYVEGGIRESTKNKLDRFLIEVTRTTGQFSVNLFYRVAGRPQKQKDDDLDSRSHVLFTVDILRSAVLAFSDQQLVTGLAILTVGLATSEDITEYHFFTVNQLAWLSFTVFGCSTEVLAEYFQQNLMSRLWRTVWITVFTASLGGTIVVVDHENWLWSFGTPMKCVWSTLRAPGFWVTVELFYMVWGYVSILNDLWPGKINALFPWIPDLLRVPTCALHRLSDQVFDRNLPRGLQILTQVSGPCLRLASLILVGLSEILGSQAFEYIRTWMILLQTTIMTFHKRSEAASDGLMEGTEKTWGFGQVVPLLLLALPLLNISEIYYEDFQKRNDKANANHNASGPQDATGSNEADLSEHDVVTAEQIPMEDAALQRARTFPPPVRWDTESRGSRRNTYAEDLSPTSQDKPHAISSAVSAKPPPRARLTHRRTAQGSDGGKRVSNKKKSTRRDYDELIERLYSRPVFRWTLLMILTGLHALATYGAYMGYAF